MRDSTAVGGRVDTIAGRGTSYDSPFAPRRPCCGRCVGLLLCRCCCVRSRWSSQREPNPHEASTDLLSYDNLAAELIHPKQDYVFSVLSLFCFALERQDLALASQERDVRPWIIVAGHRPMYATEKSDSEGLTSSGHSNR